METQSFFSDNFDPANRAFLFGDAVKVNFYVHNSKFIMAEECYFFLMASMRKMRFNIPLTYTLEFFENLFQPALSSGSAIISFMAYREKSDNIVRSGVSSYWSYRIGSVFEPGRFYEIDILKEITVNTGLLDAIQIPRAENIYAEIYASENNLDDVILLNSSKRIARASQGNLIFLEGKLVKIPKQSEGALISPLMENFVTHIHKNNLAEIAETEMNPFETQKSDEILLIADGKGIFPVTRIRNKDFAYLRLRQMLQQWAGSFD